MRACSIGYHVTWKQIPSFTETHAKVMPLQFPNSTDTGTSKTVSLHDMGTKTNANISANWSQFYSWHWNCFHCELTLDDSELYRLEKVPWLAKYRILYFILVAQILLIFINTYFSIKRSNYFIVNSFGNTISFDQCLVYYY